MVHPFGVSSLNDELLLLQRKKLNEQYNLTAMNDMGHFILEGIDNKNINLANIYEIISKDVNRRYDCSKGICIVLYTPKVRNKVYTIDGIVYNVDFTKLSLNI